MQKKSWYSTLNMSDNVMAHCLWIKFILTKPLALFFKIEIPPNFQNHVLSWEEIRKVTHMDFVTCTTYQAFLNIRLDSDIIIKYIIY